MSQPAADTMTEHQRAFADALLACGAAKFGAFRLKLHEAQPDAPLSPIYLDLRVLQSFPDALDAAVAALPHLTETPRLPFPPYSAIPPPAPPPTPLPPP